MFSVPTGTLRPATALLLVAGLGLTACMPSGGRGEAVSLTVTAAGSTVTVTGSAARCRELSVQWMFSTEDRAVVALVSKDATGSRLLTIRLGDGRAFLSQEPFPAGAEGFVLDELPGVVGTEEPDAEPVVAASVSGHLTC